MAVAQYQDTFIVNDKGRDLKLAEEVLDAFVQQYYLLKGKPNDSEGSVEKYIDDFEKYILENSNLVVLGEKCTKIAPLVVGSYILIKKDSVLEQFILDCLEKSLMREG